MKPWFQTTCTFFAVTFSIAYFGNATTLALQAENNFQPNILFLLGGQSNMSGNGFAADLTAESAKLAGSPPSNVAIWKSGKKQWIPVKPTVKFGPEIGFAHTISSGLPDQKIGIIKLAAGGTSMDRWHPEGELYTQWRAVFQEAQASAPDAKLMAVLWHQGESDSDTQAMAQAYQAKLIQLIEAIRNDTNNAKLLFFLGQINPANNFMGRPRFEHANIVRRAQAELTLEDVVLIPTDDCEKNAYVRGDAATPPEQRIAKFADNIHYSASGQLKLGKRYADAYLKTIVVTDNEIPVSPLRTDD